MQSRNAKSGVVDFHMSDCLFPYLTSSLIVVRGNSGP